MMTRPTWERASAVILRLAVLLSALYAAAVLLELLKPANGGLTAGLFYPGIAVENFIPFWGAIFSWPVAAALSAAMYVHGRRRTEEDVRRGVCARYRLAIVGTLLLPFAIAPAIDLVRFLPLVLACLLSTAFGLWSAHRMQRFRRMPAWLLLAAALGGALIGGGFGGSMNALFLDYSQAFLLWPKFAGMLSHPDPARLTDGSYLREIADAKHLVNSGLALDAGLFEELGKSAVIAALYLLYRRYWDGVVTGVVLGMAVGLGFNLLESVEYMNGAAVYQFWIRQTVGLMGAHTAFSAVVGAGFGVASGALDRRIRLRAIGTAFLTAVCGHFATDSLLFTFGGYVDRWFPVGGTVATLVIQPLVLGVLWGPFVVMYVLLLRRGLRDQASALATELTAEMASGSGAVTEAEIPVLLSPVRRLIERFRAYRRGGTPACLQQIGLRTTQLELGVTRWHRAQGVLDPRATDETILRARILSLKRNPTIV